MHIMIVIHSLRGGGAERVTANLSAYWQRLGYRVSVVTQMDEQSDIYPLEPGVQRYVLHTARDTGGGLRGWWANLRRMRRLRSLLKSQRPDCVLGMMTTSAILCQLAARGLGLRTIAVEHTYPPRQSLSPIWQKLRDWAYQRVDTVVCLTHATAQWLRDAIPGVAVTVIPNAVPWPLENMEPAVEAHKSADRLRLLAVGRYHEVKGFDRLIDAFALLAPYFPDWDLALVGEGPERKALSTQIAHYRLEDRIRLVGQVGNMSDWYQQADLYVLSSRYEGLSNTLIEAMAHGLAVVAVDCPVGPREIIRHGIDGILVNPPDEVEALAAHLSEVMGQPEKRAALARRAIDSRDRFSVPRVMTQWEAVLRGQMQRPEKRPEPQTTPSKEARS